VHGRVGGAPFTVRIDATLQPPRPGDAVRLSAPPDRLHWFDASTGLRVSD
jgi:sn-glycerol 3-phosphate transport system ATP-binding protein